MALVPHCVLTTSRFVYFPATPRYLASIWKGPLLQTSLGEIWQNRDNSLDNRAKELYLLISVPKKFLRTLTSKPAPPNTPVGGGLPTLQPLVPPNQSTSVGGGPDTEKHELPAS